MDGLGILDPMYVPPPYVHPMSFRPSLFIMALPFPHTTVNTNQGTPDEVRFYTLHKLTLQQGVERRSWGQSAAAAPAYETTPSSDSYTTVQKQRLTAECATHIYTSSPLLTRALPCPAG